MVTTFGLGEAVLVGLEVLFRSPSGAVDALQARVGLVSAPVGGRGAGDGESVADQLGGGKVRSAAEILPHDLALAVEVLIDGEFAGTDLDGGRVV